MQKKGQELISEMMAAWHEALKYLKADPVAAGEACVRLRSSRKFQEPGLSCRVAINHFATAAQPNAGCASCYTNPKTQLH
jgi:hypothetical protein